MGTSGTIKQARYLSAFSDSLAFGDFTATKNAREFVKTPGMLTVYDYWREKGGCDKPVTRDDIHPRDIQRYIDHLVILEPDYARSMSLAVPDSDEVVTFNFALDIRLMGTYVTEFYGEKTGRDVSELANPNAANRIYHMVQGIIDHDTPLLSLARAYDDTRDYMDAYGLYMPLYKVAPKRGRYVHKVMIYVEVVWEE